MMQFKNQPQTTQPNQQNDRRWRPFNQQGARRPATARFGQSSSASLRTEAREREAAERRARAKQQAEYQEALANQNECKTQLAEAQKLLATAVSRQTMSVRVLKETKERVEAAREKLQEEIEAADTAAQSAQATGKKMSLQARTTAARLKRRLKAEEERARAEGTLDQFRARMLEREKRKEELLTLPAQLRQQAQETEEYGKQAILKATQTVTASETQVQSAKAAVEQRQQMLKEAARKVGACQPSIAAPTPSMAFKSTLVRKPQSEAGKYVPPARPAFKSSSSGQYSGNRASSRTQAPDLPTGPACGNSRWVPKQVSTIPSSARGPAGATEDEDGRWWIKSVKTGEKIEYRMDDYQNKWYTRKQFLDFYKRRLHSYNAALQKWENALPSKAEVLRRRRREEVEQQAATYAGPRRELRFVNGKSQLVCVDGAGNVVGKAKKSVVPPEPAKAVPTGPSKATSTVKTVFYKSPDMRAMVIDKQTGSMKYRPAFTHADTKTSSASNSRWEKGA